MRRPAASGRTRVTGCAPRGARPSPKRRNDRYTFCPKGGAAVPSFDDFVLANYEVDETAKDLAVFDGRRFILLADAGRQDGEIKLYITPDAGWYQGDLAVLRGSA